MNLDREICVSVLRKINFTPTLFSSNCPQRLLKVFTDETAPTLAQSTRWCASCWFAYVTNSYAGVVLGVYFFTFRVSRLFSLCNFFCVGSARCCIYTRMSPEHKGTQWESSRARQAPPICDTHTHSAATLSKLFPISSLFGVRHTLGPLV
jgi:hypothetical protein